MADMAFTHLVKTVLVLAAVLLLQLPALGTTIWQEAVTVRGQVVNGTAGASAPPGLSVVLHSFGANFALLSTVRAVADAAGGFEFPDVVLHATGSYALSVEYAGVPYTTVISPQSLGTPVQLRVFEATQDVSQVRVQRQVWFIAQVNARDQQISAVEFVHLVNEGDRTLRPDLASTSQISFLRFSLPAGAQGLEVQSDLPGGEVIPIGTGFAVTAPVLPGPHEVNFSYRFPYSGGEVAFNQRLLQGADLYQVLVPARLPLVQVTGLESQPLLDLDGAVYRVWEGRDFGPGQGPVLTLSGLPRPSLAARLTRLMTRDSFWEAAIPGILGVLLAVLLLYGAAKAPRRVKVLAGPSATINGAKPEDRQALVRAIAALDHRFQQGEVDQTEYQAERGRLKAQALGVVTDDRAEGEGRS